MVVIVRLSLLRYLNNITVVGVFNFKEEINYFCKLNNSEQNVKALV